MEERRKRPVLDVFERSTAPVAVEVAGRGKRVRRIALWTDEREALVLSPTERAVVVVRPDEIPPGNELRDDEEPRSRLGEPERVVEPELRTGDEAEGREVETIRELPERVVLGREIEREELEVFGRETIDEPRD